MTNTQPSWHQHINPHSLNDILTAINIARSERAPVTRCRYLFDALNLLWNEYYSYRSANGQLTPKELDNLNQGYDPSDNQSFPQLLLRGLNFAEQVTLCHSQEVAALVTLTPQIMSQRILKKANYDPNNIDPSLAREAQQTHRKLVIQWNTYQAAKLPNADPLLKKLAEVLYIVRSNNAHGEKTPRGPDLAKVERDRAVCAVVAPVVELIFDMIFDQPSTRLAVYGTLAPGQPNASILVDLEGTWSPGSVQGILEQRDNLPVYRWITGDAAQHRVPVQVFTSVALPGRLPKLDSFEGERYGRILVPVTVGDTTVIATIYAANDE